MGKQVVFVEYVPNIINLKIAFSLKQKNYDTILITFSSIDEKFYKKAFNKIISLQINHKFNLKNIYKLPQMFLGKRWRTFIRDIRKLKPYISQITGPDLFTSIVMNQLKGPKIYFAYDIWHFFNKKNIFNKLNLKELIQREIERKGMKIADGILHKGPEYELNLLKYNFKCPHLAILPGCLKDWSHEPKKEKNREIHIVFAGGPLHSKDGRTHFIKIVRLITSQKIHFHTYGPCVNRKDEELFKKENKLNKYYHFHKKKRVDELNKEISSYDYGINPDFYNTSIINPLWPKTSVANRIFNYIEAGIPIIINKDAEYMTQIVQKEKIGFVINQEDLKDIKGMLKKQNYIKLQGNLKKTQQKLFWEDSLLQNLEKFYEKIYRNHNSIK